MSKPFDPAMYLALKPPASPRLPRGKAASYAPVKQPSGTGVVRVQHPNGQTGSIPAHQLNSAIAQGYRPLVNGQRVSNAPKAPPAPTL